jgi:formate dehydrogenase iron-sulfur subunit
MHSERSDEREHAPVALQDTEPLQGVTRRKFLGLCPVAAATAAIAATSPEQGSTVPHADELAAKHAGDPSVLIDVTRCVGCGSCVKACKADNDLETRYDQPAEGPDAALSSTNWTIVQPHQVGEGGTTVTVKKQCMHCLEPACASVCFMKAIYKSDAGPVVYDVNRCVGCRYCIMACPFGVPTFDYEARMGRVNKCDMCVDRTSKGLPTACSEVCPGGAITFGTREEMLSEAHDRMAAEPGRYIDHIYGEHEVGGTGVMYMSDVEFSKLGFPSGLPDEALPGFTHEITRLIPPAAAGIGTLLIWLYARRVKVLKQEEDARALAAQATATTTGEEDL